MRSPVQVLALLDSIPPPSHHHVPQPHGLAHAPEGVPYMVSQLPSGCQDQGEDAVRINGQGLQYWESKGQSFALPSLGHPYTVPPSQDRGDTRSLHRGGGGDAQTRELLLEPGADAKRREC